MDQQGFREILESLGLTQAGLARLLIEMGDDRNIEAVARSVRRMATGKARVSGEMLAFLGLLELTGWTSPRTKKQQEDDFAKSVAQNQRGKKP